MQNHSWIRKNKGSTFFVSIPYKPVKKGNITNKTDEYETKNKKFTILIAEDEEINSLYLETLIIQKIKLNCKIIHAKNGQEAIEILQNKDISLILMDIKMPIINGFEATIQIRKFNKNIPIIAQTAYSSGDDKEKILDNGFDDFLTKPITKESLENIMIKYTKK